MEKSEVWATRFLHAGYSHLGPGTGVGAPFSLRLLAQAGNMEWDTPGVLVCSVAWGLLI